jgi:hypothetical protein
LLGTRAIHVPETTEYAAITGLRLENTAARWAAIEMLRVFLRDFKDLMPLAIRARNNGVLVLSRGIHAQNIGLKIFQNQDKCATH